MIATCHHEAYTLAPLPSGYVYSIPGKIYSSPCECSTIGYSLLSACDACQGENPLYWSTFVANCTSTLPPSQFPNAVPSGVYVPNWAILDVTGSNTWDASAAFQAGDKPEYGPGTFFGPNSITVPTTTTTPTPSFTGHSSGSGGKSSNAGAIAGGVVGGIAAFSVAVAVILYLRGRRSRMVSAGIEASQPMLNNGMVTQSSTGSPLTMKFYDPNDPTTFPGHQGTQQSLDTPSTPQVPLSSHVGSGSMADLQTSQFQAMGYHGLPMPSS
jgi:hypothetical protein